MSNAVLKGNASGTGTVTLETPNTNSDFTISLPAVTGSAVIDSATQTLTNKTLTSPTLTTPNINSAQIATVSGTAPLYMCRAWVNFNGTGTVAIRASGNVSSITDNGVGDYTVNFTTAMPDANFSTVVSVKREASFTNPPTTAVERYAGTSRPNTTTTTTVMCGDQAAFRDSSLVLVSVNR
jgi:hypothetical protein